MTLFGSHAPRLLPPIPPWLRLTLAGCVVAAMAYLLYGLEHPEPDASAPPEVVEKVVAVPRLDQQLLATARDATRAQRLQIEAEPLRHLLAQAINVGPTVAAALGTPEQPVPLADLRAEPDQWRGRWLWYEGRLEQLSAPRPGNPVPGYSIYEATVRLPGDELAMAAFSVQPDASIAVGDWVRIEGYLLKLRDTTYPFAIASAPMLVGRSLQRDYEDWPPVPALDDKLLATVDDSSFWPGDLRYHDVEEDQTEALWHLGAFVRDTADQRTFAQWRKIRTLNAAEAYDELRRGEIKRGTPMRVFGTLIRRQTIAAPPNPANIKFWTTAFVQVREFGGHLVPIWVPKRVRDLPLRASLEVRGFYYRWFAYEAESGDRISVPLFIAADLDTFDLGTDQTMRAIGVWIIVAAIAFLALVLWGQRRMARAALQHSRDMDERRRRRRSRSRAASAAADDRAPDLDAHPARDPR